MSQYIMNLQNDNLSTHEEYGTYIDDNENKYGYYFCTFTKSNNKIIKKYRKYNSYEYHRLDGPAVVYHIDEDEDGPIDRILVEEYYILGVEYSKEEYWKRIRLLCFL